MTEPLKRFLRPALSTERVERIWRRVAEQRDRKSVRVHRAPKLALASAFAVLLCAGGWLAFSISDGPANAPLGDAVATTPIARPIARMDGRALGDIMTTTSPTVVALNDGSELQVSPRTRLTPLDLSERAVVLHLVRGRARFAVKPGGPRRWVIEAGGASVEVVGTKFTVEREQGLVNVRVEEGKVLVRSASIEDGVARLVAGQSLVVPARGTGANEHGVPLEAVEALDVAVQPPASTIATSTAAVSTSASAAKPSASNPESGSAQREPAQRAAVEREGFVLGALDASTLLDMADKARMKRDYRAALGALDRVVQEHGKDPRAKLAAFTIGRIRDEELLDPERAAQAYELALSLGLTGPLAEDCRVRLLRVLETQVKRGRVSGQRVQDAAREYLRRYPKGRYAVEARAKLNGENAERDGGGKLHL